MQQKSSKLPLLVLFLAVLFCLLLNLISFIRLWAAAALSSTTIKLDNIKPLTGSDNYEAWSSQLSLILFAIGAKDLVVSGVKPDGMTNDRKVQLPFLIIIQLVSEPILAQISNLSDAHEMWVYLRENYFSDT